MKKSVLALAIACAVTGSNAIASSTDDRLAALEKRLAYLEQRIQSQDEVIREKDQQIAEMRAASGSDGGWFQSVEIGGLVEVEASHTSPDGGPDESDIIVPTVELGINAKINDWVSGELVLLYEERTDNDGELNIDTAVLNIADPNANWFINAGHFFVPFGTFETHMVSDPLTLDLAETSDSAFEFGIDMQAFTASAYVFQGDHDSEINNFGLALNSEIESGNVHFAGHLGYINNLAESNGIVDGGWITAGNESAAWIASAQLNMGPFALIAEYLAATEGFADAGNQKPKVYNVEAAYSFDAGSLPATVAIGYQGTEDASHANFDLAENRILGAISFEVAEGTSLAFEYATEEDYAGAQTDTITGLLAVEF